MTDPPQPQNGTVTHADDQTQNEQASGITPPIAPSGWHPEERKHHAQERKHWWIVNTLTAVAAGGAIASSLLAFGALRNSQKGAESALQAAHEARRQADAAEQGLVLAGNQFIQDNRPYVWLSNDLGSPQLTQAPSGNQQIVWTWYFINYGKTPAISVETRTFMKRSDGAFQPSYRPSGEATIVGVPLPANLTLRRAVISEPVTQELWNQFLKTDNGISISGVIDYVEFSGNRYQSTFCVGRLATGAIAFREPSENCHNEIK